MSTIEALNASTELAPVRLVASTNQSGTYFNGNINNGVGATLTYATGALTIDSVAVVLGDYILLAGQTAGYQNGIYQCTQAGATGVTAILTRRGDFQCIEQVKAGYFVPVCAGTVYAGSVWTVTEDLPAGIGLPVVSGANDINFTTITGSGSSLYLQKTENLADLVDVPTALLNLGLGPTVINYTTVTISAAQFNGMYAAPKLLVAAGGANTLLVLKQLQLVMTYAGAAYAAGGVAAVQYDSTANGAGVIASTTLSAATFQATASSTFTMNPGVVVLPFTTTVNKGLYLSNLTGAFTTGTGTFVAHVWYALVPTA